MSQRRLISSGSAFEKVGGYSRAVAQGDWCWVSGTTGYDYAAMVMPETLEAQTRNAMTTITKALNEAGFHLADVRPAATMIVCGLVKPEMKIEIEVTAKRKA